MEENKVVNIENYFEDHSECCGITEVDSACNVISFEDKPKKTKSKFTVVGLYFTFIPTAWW